MMEMDFIRQMPIPQDVKKEFPVSKRIEEVKKRRDEEIRNVFSGKSDRLLLIIGPCSADNEDAVIDYITRLHRVQDKVEDKILMIPRIYTNKPRTIGVGYKGMLHQPDPQKGEDMLKGIIAIRQLHTRAVEETGFTCADEMLYPENYRYLSDILSYVAVGARSVEDQEHRFVASGIDVPTGMKNPTSGNLNVMFNGIYAAQNKQNFIYHSAEVDTDGNPLAHAILRGATNEHGENEPNYYYDDLLKAIDLYEKMSLENPFIVVDTNHDNSGKNYLEQIRIVRQTLINRDWNDKINKYVRGFMIESYLEDGRQDAPEVFGKSITDPCLGWEKTEQLIREIHATLSRDSFEELLF